MRLSAIPLINFQNINSYQSASQWIVRASDPNTLYFQLVDLDQNSLRYIAGVGLSNQPASVSVIFPSIDSSKVLTLTAVQNVNDGSVWSVSIPSTSSPQTGNVKFQVVEGANARSFFVTQMIVVEGEGCGGDAPLADNVLPY